MEVMQMGTLRHRKPIVSKPADRKIAIKKSKTPGKFGRFARRLGLVAGIATGIIAPSLSNAQGNIKTQVNKPTDKQTEIMMNAAGENLPPNTKVYGTPKDSNMSYTDKSAKKIEPGLDPSQKWCDGIEIENGQLIFKGVSAHEKHGDASIDYSLFLKKIGIPDATTENITWQELRIIDGIKKAYFIIEKGDISILVTSNPDFEKDDTWGKAIGTNDKTEIFKHDGAIIITDDGSVIATTPTTLLIIKAGRYGEKIGQTYKRMFGEEASDMKKPWFVKGNSKNIVEMRDETLITPGGKRLVMTIPIDNLSEITVGIDDRLTKN